VHIIIYILFIKTIHTNVIIAPDILLSRIHTNVIFLSPIYIKPQKLHTNVIHHFNFYISIYISMVFLFQFLLAYNPTTFFF